MNKIGLMVSLLAGFYSLNANALSPEATEGKALYPTCHACHNPTMEPSLAPPMWGVQRRYKKATKDGEEFVNNMVSFVKAPTLETAIHDEALKQRGLMPAMPLPDDMLRKIAMYILEEEFPPPCAHWKMAVKVAKEKGDLDHAKKDLSQLKRFCS